MIGSNIVEKLTNYIFSFHLKFLLKRCLEEFLDQKVKQQKTYKVFFFEFLKKDSVFQLKFTAKQFERDSKKALKDEAAQKKKVKQAIEKGNMDGARIYAQNAIRKKNESQNYLRLSSRLEAVSARMDTAIKMNKVTKTMGNVVGAMDTVLGTMNVEKVKKIKFKNNDLDFNNYG
jgi:hypothetical protein